MSQVAWVSGLVRHRMLILSGAVGLTALSWWLAPQLNFDRSIENMFPADSSVLASYQKLKRTFGGNEIVLAVYRDPRLLAPDGNGLVRLRSISQRLKNVDGVKAVLSLDQPLPGEMILQDNAMARRTRELFCGFTHGEDGETVSVVCMLYPRADTDVPRRETIDGMRSVMHSLPDGLPPGWLTGEPVLVVDGFRYVEQDGNRLGTWSMLLLGLTICICFRSLRWVLIPVLVVQLALLLTKTILAVAQMRLSMVSSMLTAVVMVVGVATMVHIMVRFSESRSLGYSPVDSLRRTLEQLFVPITWACVTDAVGFLALTVSDVGPVHDFGVMMAIGSMMVWVSVLLLVPGLSTLGSVDADPQSPWGEDQLVEQLDGLLAGALRRPYVLLIALAGLVLLATCGINRLHVETDFTRNFRWNSEIATAYRYVEDHLGGAGVCDVMIPADDKIRWSDVAEFYELGQQVRHLEPTEEGEFTPVTKAFSFADALVELSPIDMHNQPRLVQESLTVSGVTAMRSWMPEFFEALYGVDPRSNRRYARLMLRIPERQDAAQKRALIKHVQETVDEAVPGAEVTGYFVLLSHLIDSVLRDQWRTFIVAIAGIGVLMAIAFRSLRLAVIALIPNTLPVLVVLGGMGWLSSLFWFDLKINMGTAMIAAVSVGLSIDSSIHYIIGFQRAVGEGLSVEQALSRVQSRVGKALVLSTLALAVGFTVLASSDFVPTVYFGVLVTLAMLGALAGNLLGLPLLIYLFYRPSKTRTDDDSVHTTIGSR